MNLLEIKELLSANSGTLLAIAIFVMTVIEITPIKINPWTAVRNLFSKIFAWLGKTFNGAMLTKLDELEKAQAEMQKKLDKHIRLDDERDAKNTRKSILRFNADLIDGKNFTHEYFVDMLKEIDDYETYCREHEKFKNGRAVMAIANIKRVCEEHERKGDFAK